jgi:hypothetical protein
MDAYDVEIFKTQIDQNSVSIYGLTNRQYIRNSKSWQYKSVTYALKNAFVEKLKQIIKYDFRVTDTLSELQLGH